jgi:hypothetical protein
VNDHDQTTSAPATKATALQLARLAERNLFHFCHQANHEIDRATDRDDEIAIAHIGVALCQARAVIRKAIESVEAAK